jgi:hypothetical protein
MKTSTDIIQHPPKGRAYRVPNCKYCGGMLLLESLGKKGDRKIKAHKTQKECYVSLLSYVDIHVEALQRIQAGLKKAIRRK